MTSHGDGRLFGERLGRVLSLILVVAVAAGLYAVGVAMLINADHSNPGRAEAIERDYRELRSQIEALKRVVDDLERRAGTPEKPR